MYRLYKTKNKRVRDGEKRGREGVESETDRSGPKTMNREKHCMRYAPTALSPSYPHLARPIIPAVTPQLFSPFQLQSFHDYTF